MSFGHMIVCVALFLVDLCAITQDREGGIGERPRRQPDREGGVEGRPRRRPVREGGIGERPRRRQDRESGI